MAPTLVYGGGVNVIAVQFDIAWENKPANFRAAHRLLQQAPPPKDSLVALPEMFATGFNMNTERVAEPYGGPTEQFLAAAAREFGIYLLAGVAAQGRDGRSRNKAVVFTPAGDLLAYYAKRRLFTPGGEGEHYVAGEQPTVFRWSGINVCPLICYDLRFPELFREAAFQHRPELFVVIASWPEKRIPHWLKLLQARAIENQAYVLGVNRIGNDPYYSYSGRSAFVDPQGEILADAGESEGFIQGEVDLDSLAKYREGLPFLSDLKEIG